MPDPVWYYARGEVEKGPFSTSQIKALAAAGRIRSEDFVWKEGMESWVPAGEISELSPENGYPAKDSKQESTAEASGAEDAGAGRPYARPAYAARRTAEQPDVARLGGYLLAMLGLASTLIAQGCEMVGGRRVARCQAAASAAELEFRTTWQDRLGPVQRELRKLGPGSESDPADPAQRRRLSEQLSELQKRMQTEEAALRDTSWRDLLATAERAEVENHMWSYWRSLYFFGGMLLLASGLVAVAYATQGAERWTCLASLMVVLYVMCCGSAFTPDL
jgi:hypothetical protein